MKPHTLQVYDEVVTDTHYLPLPTTYILYVLEDSGYVEWMRGPVKTDLENNAPFNKSYVILEQKL